jgi:hypothetical protein
MKAHGSGVGFSSDIKQEIEKSGGIRRAHDWSNVIRRLLPTSF